MVDAEGLTAKSVRSMRSLGLLQVANIVMQIAFMAVMSRLLQPAEFGIFAFASILLRLVSYFADLGMGSALIQARELTQLAFRQILGVNVVAGIALTLISLGCVALYNFVWPNPESHVIMLLSVTFVLSSVGISHIAYLTRLHRLGTVAILEGVSYFVGFICIGIPLGLIGAGVYSLVAAALSQTALRSVLALFCSKQPATPAVPRSESLDMLKFGGNVSLIGFLEFWGSNLDAATVGKFAGAIALGQYNRATSLVALPSQYLGTTITRALLPSFARGNRDQAGRGIYIGATILAGSIVPVLSVAATMAPVLVSVVLGPQWTEAATILPVICAAVVFNVLTQVPAVACEGQGILKPKLLIQVVQLCLIAVGLALAAIAAAPLIYFAAAWAVSEIVRHFGYLLVQRRFGFTVSLFLKIYARAVISSLPSLISVLLVNSFVMPDSLKIAIAIVVAGVALGATTCFWHRAPLRVVNEVMTLPRRLQKAMGI